MENRQSLLDDLNTEQKDAVTTDNQYTIVLAGAGSGKTRVLVHRIAWLCMEKHYSPHSIFAVTFTNKAAAEMQERIQHLIGEGYFNGMWVGTFHGLTHRLLRMFSQQAKLPSNFQLIDTEDQIRLIKRIFRELKIDEKQWSAKECASFISNQKEKGLRAKDLIPEDPKQIMWQSIYNDYQAICDRVGYVDFSELILRAYELLCSDKDVLSYCQHRFSNILIDEFQDTNHIQYSLVKKLAGTTANVMIVGDDDQSIYSWRGANADNLQLFIHDFPETEIIRLEQNYRSTSTILDAANQLIAKNQNRLGKNLWTDRNEGEKISLYVGFNDIDEARFVIGQIKKYHDAGEKYSSCAILYRNNVQSRLFEDTLLQAGLPYQIYGSIRFYERQEVKLALAYLRLLHDHDNDMAFEATVNTPTRGIGNVTLDKIRLTAKQNNISLWNACLMLIQMNGLTERQRSGVSRFLELMGSIYDEVAQMPFYQQLDILIKSSGIQQMYEQEPGIKGQSRLENLEELVSAAEQFYRNNENTVIEDSETGQTLTVLESFLAYTSLESRDVLKEQDSVQLMTLHAAKGLEFDNVFIVGLEEGLFPAQRSALEIDRMEEERRLAYVGITRARKHLTLSLCELRRLYGREERNLPSRFLAELPVDRLNEISYRGFFAPPEGKLDNLSQEKQFQQNRRQSYLDKSRESDGYTLGRKVKHHRFGEGTIINLDGEGDHRRVQIAFVNEGIKWLVIKLANLTLL
ncbi:MULTISPECIES: DNA helicase II [unclassified Gilliamella]|uniref:DNA helicase II n=1 Tax=unclassified Gilliamella TaxID=2685620 RepID=UPI0022699F2E|nr:MULTISPECIES: DNA helicase II [unclassified Gilliamella]MCX8573531.1 DNA helicase II [Gilliamella sp. B3831]MCX8575841.1 DNA helicase II [Gilliamella sp. B3815]MCX8590042.1 DNA helicase II [Gilliamella sp. B3812]MCX8602943.1 DNA helicase II [Gilliamella sp. B3823]MCX8605240.1 DNA helicase II [Gilliamella sp. B3825]